MKYKILFTLTFLLLSAVAAKGQVYLGIRAEPLFYLADVDNQADNPHASISKGHSFESNISFSIPFSFKVSDQLKLSIRPGFIFGNLFWGLNFGFLGNYSVSDRDFTVAGINTLINGEWGGHTYNGNNISTSFITLGYGRDLSKNFPIEIQFNFPLNKHVYGTYRESAPYSTINHRYSVAWMFRISFGFEWEL